MEVPQRSARRSVDGAALAATRRRLERAPEPPWLHGEVARRMAERLAIVKLQPACVLDWPAFLGAGGRLLQQAYPQARLLPIEPVAPPRAAPAQTPWWSPRRWIGTQAARPPCLEADIVPGQAQLVWSNMALHFESDPPRAMRLWQQALSVDGFLMFSTLGPGSLRTLSALYADAGWGPPFAPLVDMHDLGDMLVEAGFADPVMDQEIVTLTWAGPGPLLAELRALGGNADPARVRGLRTPRWRRRLEAALQARADAAGRIALEFEIVYGHAFKPPPRARLAAETSVPLADLRAMVRSRRGG